MNAPTLIILLFVILFVVKVFADTFGFGKKKKAGGCGGSCGSCPHAEHCKFN